MRVSLNFYIALILNMIPDALVWRQRGRDKCNEKMDSGVKRALKKGLKMSFTTGISCLHLPILLRVLTRENCPWQSSIFHAITTDY